MINKEQIEKAVTEILIAIGDDPNRAGIKETPKRVTKAYEEIFSGLNDDPKIHLAKTFEVSSDSLVVQAGIEFYSMCEHHLLPFFGKVHIAYLPNEKVVGLSKLARCVEVYAKRPQLQEQLTKQIADALTKNLDTRGVLVIIEADHMCMNMRGVKKPGANTKTIVTTGELKENIDLKNEALFLINSGR